MVGDIDQLDGSPVSRFPWETGWAEARLVRDVLSLSPVDHGLLSELFLLGDPLKSVLFEGDAS